MLTLALALALSATDTTSFPFAKGVAVQGVQWDAGNYQAYGVICGSNMSCAPQNGNFGWLLISATSDGGGGSSGAPTNASYITEVAESGLSAEFAMASLGTGLVKNTTTTGVPSIYGGTSCSNQFVRSLNASASATCNTVSLTSDVAGIAPVANGGTGSAPGGDDQVLVSDSSSAATWHSLPNCTDTGGNHLNYTASTNGWSCGTSSSTVPGGTNTQVQYNCAGAFCGAALTFIDGGMHGELPRIDHPPPPSDGRLQYSFQVLGGAPQMPWEIASVIGQPMPQGIFSNFAFNGTNPVWRRQCCFPGIGATTTAFACQGDDQTAPTVVNGSAGVAWDAGSFFGRTPKFLYQAVASTNANAGLRSGAVYAWRGSSIGGAGGFVGWVRFSFGQVPATVRVFVGFKFGTANAVSATDGPSSNANVVYMGREPDAGDGRCRMCSNDGTGLGTCTELDAGFPCNSTTVGWYDLWLWEGPSDGGTGAIDYAVQRLDDTTYAARGTITSDLPMDYAQGGWQIVDGNAYVSATSQLNIMGYCTIWGL